MCESRECVDLGCRSPSYRVVLYIYVSECSPDEYRGWTAMIVSAGGNLILLLIAPFCLPATFATDEDWYLLPAFSLLLAVIHLLFGATLPESPKHLYIGREHQRDASREAAAYYHESGAHLDQVMAEFERERRLMRYYSESATLVEIVRNPTLRWSLVIVMIGAFVPAVSLLNVKSQYLETMLMRFGLSQSLSMISTMVVSAVTAPLCLLAPWMVERFGRRPLFILITVFSTAELAFVMVAQAMVDWQGGHGSGWFVPAVGLVGLTLGGASSMLGILSMSPILIGEFTPHAARAVTTQFFQVVPMPLVLAVVVGYPVVSAHYGALFLLPMLTASCLLLYLMYLYLPETRGLPVDTIYHRVSHRAHSVLEQYRQGLVPGVSSSAFLHRRHQDDDEGEEGSAVPSDPEDGDDRLQLVNPAHDAEEVTAVVNYGSTQNNTARDVDAG